MDYAALYQKKLTSAAEAVKVVKSGDWVDYGWCTNHPYTLDKALAARQNELKDVKVRGGVTMWMPEICKAEDAGEHFTWNSWHCSGIDRKIISKGMGYFIPMRYSELPRFYRDGNATVDVAMIQVTPMDKHGNFSYALACSHLADMLDAAKTVIVEVNENLPWVYGLNGCEINIKDVDMVVEGENPPVAQLGAGGAPTEVDTAVANLVVPEQSKATVVSHMVSSYMENGSLTGLRELADFASNVTDAEFLICNSDGNLLLTTDTTLVNRVLTVPQDVAEGAMSDDTYAVRTTLGNIYEDTHFVVGVPIVSEGATVGFVLAVTGARALTTMWRTFIGLFFMTAVTVLLLSFVVSAWVSMRQSRPIHEMAEATRRFAEGNFDVRMHNYEGVTEITELAESFNNMADSLQETERQRREFIANVSHELKTPMTTIAGYTDGILDGTIPPEQEKEYLRIISDAARRLSRIVRRMLEVSQLQSRDLTRTKAPFDVCESMRRVLISMEKKITDRGLDVDADIPDSGIMVLGDNDLITQVIYNLLENATKFARKGSALYLGVATLNGKALISVRNEGDTIPAEEIPLLFERFHKSDKSRSEDKDGVGLGLYVVKTILDQHKEHIAVTSENGLTTFTFSVTLAGGQTAQ